MITAGVGGPLTGRGADLLIVDDSIKNAEEALSPTIRDAQWDWWQSVASTRIEPGGMAILMGTRWHADDLQGRVLAASESGNGPAVTRIRMPAIAEEDDLLGRQPGEPLWPERWSLTSLQQRQSALDQYWWSAMYQQAPGRHGSTEWPAEYFDDHIWTDGLPERFEPGVIAVDPSKGRHGNRGDYSAIVFVGLADGFLWVDSSIVRRPVERIVSDGIDMATQYSTSLHGFAVEVNQFQELLVAEFEKQTAERRLAPLPIYTINNTVNKKLRISRLGPYFCRDKLRFLDTPSNRLLISQAKQFSMKDVTGVHDDGPDALEMAIRTITELAPATASCGAEPPPS
jgi:predicted phage terminase large subunit-like protein